MSEVRKPGVAGQFYPAEAAVLRQMVEGFLVDAPSGKKPQAVIAPHAGYVYSGLVAGRVYAELKPWASQIGHVILLGPAHRFGFAGIATSKKDFFATPLGLIPLDRRLIERALRVPNVAVEERAFEGEHSLEVQLPFLQAVLGEFKLSPFVIGADDGTRCAALIEALWDTPNTLVVVSSDLSHFLSYADCQQKDAQTARAIIDMQPQAIDDEGACGRVPIKGLLKVAQAKGLSVSEVARNNSGDTAGDKQRVVGYGGYTLY